jgi:DNA-directed RNA polymerase specialized sigma24 family protein
MATEATSPSINQTDSKVWGLVLDYFDEDLSLGEMLENGDFEKWTIGICKRILRRFEYRMSLCYRACYEPEDLRDDIYCNLLASTKPFTRAGTPDAIRFTGYIRRIGTNIVFSKLRRRLPLEEMSPDDESGYWAFDFERDRFLKEFYEFAGRHSKTRRLAVEMRIAKFTISEIAAELHCSETMVQKHIHGAVNGFRKQFERG